MSEIRGETVEKTRSVEKTDDEEESSYNIVSVISQFADDNLGFVRNISTGLAIAGVIVIARSIKLITKFGTVSEIPARFIERNVSLRGRVHTITEKGLDVEHVPIYLPVLSPLLAKRMCASSLAVRLAGVELTPEGRVWLENALAPAQVVWLRLISREEDVLHCFVSHNKGSVWNQCVNEELLRQGLARTVPIYGVPPDSRLYWRLHKRLLKAEGKAEKKGLGLWKEDSLWERTSKAVEDNIFVRFIRRLFKRT